MATPEFSQLVNESDYIVRAVVKSVRAEERPGAKGSRLIFSKVELEVKEVIAGRPPSPLVLEMLGGRIGDRELAISGAPKFNVGDDSILFVQNNGRQVYPLVRLMHGMYRVSKASPDAREHVERSNGKPLRHVSEVSGPLPEHAPNATSGTARLPTLSPTDFIQLIRAAVTKPALREK